MSINKVVYGNDTLIDLTEDTVAPENLLSGATAHNAAGNPITGTARQGHDIYYSGSTLPMAGRAGLQFNDVEVEDDATNNKTIVMPQIRTCATQAEWDLIPDDVKNSPLIYWYLPFINGGDPLNSDKTPVGVVISASTPTAQTGEFPNKDYLVCDGNIVNISDYPQLAQYFQTYYGSKNYFGGDGITTFKLPDYSRDYPQNGVLCIKAAVSGNIITFAEVDETGISSREDQVPNCARVAGIESGLSNKKGEVRTWTFSATGNISANSSMSVNFPSQTLSEGYNMIGFLEAHTNKSSVIGSLLATGGASGRTYTPQYIFYNLSSSTQTNVTFYLNALIQKN